MKALWFLLLSTLTLTAAETLHVYTWADYISPDIVEKFEDKNDCRVVIDTFDSNEAMFAKLKAGAAGYDVIFPTTYMIQVMVAEGMLSSLDAAALPNMKQVDPAVVEKIGNGGMKHSVPYTVGYAITAYRKDKVTTAPASWTAFTQPALAGRMTLLDDMRETIGAALKSLGYSINTRDEKQLAEAQQVLLGWKKNIAKFDNEGYKAGLDSGEFLLVHGYSGDLFQVAQENSKVGLLIPQEGVTMSCDEMVIPKSAPKPALAHAFINFLLDPEIAAENMEWMGYLCPNPDALKKVSPEFLQNPAVIIPEDIKAKSEVIQDVGADLAKYTRVWDAVKK
ncbi:spermidine/putrescine transport system substrate-binding protein [Prosthecobacter fusiformis]|uniref:Spermidine/putrescine transport system substrate-binding protein n=1 Tax=Prosthecobacter fusiformis TaxID=48464 RepID=A0A4R7S3I8_9BACT|nr:spermidine/putrescine ABC transporter substrate-binding protein [Prosthecobacter fusiformis]TDU72834.1 spermidine/putrescine transport system substrate-binding protein [Prosthecobacter fusiformis]